MENKHASYDLSQMQALPLESKIQMTKRRIAEWYDHWDGRVYVSFSGGKDSTVLLHIAREMFPDIRAIYWDTGVELPDVRRFVKSRGDVEMIRPKMTFVNAVKMYGYPVFGKEVADKLNKAKSYIRIHREELTRAIGKDNPTMQELSWEAAKWSYANAYLNNCYRGGGVTHEQG